MHAYLAAVLREIGCPSMRVGGTADHVHLLFGISRSLALQKVVETVKTSSSKWIKTRDARYRPFHWQSGYGAFSISPSHVAAAVRYIENQESHHRRVTFQDELRRLLQRYGVEYDERYIWD